MNNILILNNQNLILGRINSLSENSKRHWGKMIASQMVCHCADQIKMATGKIKISVKGNIIQKTLLKNIILLGMPAPKGKVKTYKELDQLVRGTKPTTFEKDKQILINLVKNFDLEYPNNNMVEHPSFGKMNKKQWGRLIYIHLDHHLKQFGV